MNVSTLSEMQLDALRETGSIGAGHAATALSQLVGRAIDIDVPTLEVISVADVPSVFGGAETLVAAIYTRLLGDLSGGMLFVAPRDASLALVDLLRSRETGTARSLGSEEQALVSHAAQILISSYLAAVARLADLSILPAKPAFALDMAGAILEGATAEIGVKAEAAVLQRTRFHAEDDTAVDAYLFFMPDPDGLEVLLGRLGVA